jgi:hypothetical protein
MNAGTFALTLHCSHCRTPIALAASVRFSRSYVMITRVLALRDTAKRIELFLDTKRSIYLFPESAP